MMYIDDNELKNKKKGDKFIYVSTNRYKSQVIKELTVTRVNNKFIYGHSNEERYNKYKFDLDNHFEVVKCGDIGRCYSSRDIYEKEKQIQQKGQSIIDCIERMHTISDANLINAMYELMNNWKD